MSETEAETAFDPVDEFLLPDGRFIPAQPERDPLMRRLAGYASLHRRPRGLSAEDRLLVRDELTRILRSIEAKFGIDEVEHIRGELTARDIRRLVARPVGEVTETPRVLRLRELADAEGLRWHYENRHAWERQRADEKLARALARERAAIAAWLRKQGIVDDVADCIRHGRHHDDEQIVLTRDPQMVLEP